MDMSKVSLHEASHKIFNNMGQSGASNGPELDNPIDNITSLRIRVGIILETISKITDNVQS
jgi:hypothetical protein